MNFLIIDDNPEYRSVLRYHLEVEWPDCVVEEFQPNSAGPLPASLIINTFDMLLLGYPLDGEGDFDWLRALRRRSQCPPIVLFAERSDEFLAVDALKAGAASFFPKAAVKHQRLIDTIRSELSGPSRVIDHTVSGAKAPHASPRNYELLETLHSNDLVSIYLAKSEDGGEPMAFKVIRYVPDAGGGHLFDRFLQEYEVIAGVEHPNIVRIFDLGIADDHAYIAMEYLPAGSLADRLNTSLGQEHVLSYVEQIASALEAIHASGILHRDLKPGNIMFRADDSLALIDFGLAKQMKLQAAITGVGQIFGTPYYMSPEQGHAEPTDERSDIYSLGCILYEMLTGQRPFVASSAMGVIYKHANAARPELNGGHQRLQPLLDRMFAIDPDKRFQSARELLTTLRNLNATPVGAALSRE